MDGQATAPELGGLDELASFLDTPDEEPTEETEATPADESTAESDNDEPANDEQEEESADDEPADDEPAPVEKITVKVKTDDGEETLELTPDEIAASYLRQKDYTKKTQALAERESQAVEFLKTKHDEVRQHYLTQAEVARSAVAQLAGFRTEDELAQLAQTDPAAWVSEVQRQKQLGGFLQGLDQQIATEKQRAQAENAQRQQHLLQQQYQKTWSELEKEKIDKPKLAKIYSDVNKAYGFDDKELANVYDHRLVKMMRDATAYRELQAQKAIVTKKVSAAPKMPSKQTPPANERKSRELASRFQGGRAKLNDLAAYLA